MYIYMRARIQKRMTQGFIKIENGEIACVFLFSIEWFRGRILVRMPLKLVLT